MSNLNFNSIFGNKREVRTINDHFKPIPLDNYSSIALPDDQERQFELHPSLINMIKSQSFGGDKYEDPYSHLKNFIMICDTVQKAGVSPGRVRLILFPFSFKDRASL